MSAQRDALEAAQARLRALEARPEVDPVGLARELLEEADRYQQVLARGEHRVLAKESAGTGGRLMTFGFALLFVAPLVSMVGVSASKFLRHQQELAVVLLVLGGLLVLGTLLRRVRRSVAHLWSPEWRLVRQARRMAARLDALV